MPKCSHDLPLEQKCAQCLADGLAAQAVQGEHLVKETVSEDFYYPDHDGRTESLTFERTKREGKKARPRCAMTGQAVDLEWHHAFIEWAFQNAVDWTIVKAIALGTIAELPVLDPITWQPTGEMAPVEGYLIYWIVLFFKWRGFDFEAFDPKNPETLVDSTEAMLILHKHLHREKNHGAHAITGPIFLLQAFPLVEGFVFSPDELAARHQLPVTTHQTA
jgi:hypothetical protein